MRNNPFLLLVGGIFAGILLAQTLNYIVADQISEPPPSPPAQITVVHLGTPQDLENLRKAQWVDMDSATVTKVEAWVERDQPGRAIVEFNHNITCMHGVVPGDLNGKITALLQPGDEVQHLRVYLDFYAFSYGRALPEITSEKCELFPGKPPA